jgi:hypothetical protein
MSGAKPGPIPACSGAIRMSGIRDAKRKEWRYNAPMSGKIVTPRASTTRRIILGASTTKKYIATGDHATDILGAPGSATAGDGRKARWARVANAKGNFRYAPDKVDGERSDQGTWRISERIFFCRTQGAAVLRGGRSDAPLSGYELRTGLM